MLNNAHDKNDNNGNNDRITCKNNNLKNTIMAIMTETQINNIIMIIITIMTETYICIKQTL